MKFNIKQHQLCIYQVQVDENKNCQTISIYFNCEKQVDMLMSVPIF